MSRFKLYFFIFLLCFQFCWAEISDKRLCLDEKCSQPISKGTTMLGYPAPDSYQLSFAANEQVTIYSKSAGSNEELWGVEIQGKRGYIPHRLVRETKMYTSKKPTFLVDTELVASSKPKVPSSKETVRPSKVAQSHEVIDGTTIYPINDDPFDDSAEVISAEKQQETVDEVSEPNSSKEVDSTNAQITETSTESGGYLSGMFDSVMDLVNSTVNHINTLGDEQEEEKEESPKSDSKEDTSKNGISSKVSDPPKENNVDVETMKTNIENISEKNVDSEQKPVSNNKENVSDMNPNSPDLEVYESSTDIKHNENVVISETYNSDTKLEEKIDSQENIDMSSSEKMSNSEEKREKSIEKIEANEIKEKSDNSTSNTQVVPDIPSSLMADSMKSDNVIENQPTLNSEESVGGNIEIETGKNNDDLNEFKPILSFNENVARIHEYDTKEGEITSKSNLSLSPDESVAGNKEIETGKIGKNITEPILGPNENVAEIKENDTNKGEKITSELKLSLSHDENVVENKENDNRKDEENASESKPILSPDESVVGNKENYANQDEENMSKTKPDENATSNNENDTTKSENMNDFKETSNNEGVLGNEIKTKNDEANATELKPIISVDESINEKNENATEEDEVETKADNLNDLQKESVTDKPWFVPTRIPVESPTILPIINGISNPEVMNASEVQKETESTSFTTETPIESLKNDWNSDHHKEILDKTNEKYAKTEEQLVNEGLVNDTEKIGTLIPDSTPSYAEYVTPTYPPMVVEANTQKYEKIQKPDEYSDSVKENESLNNDYVYNDMQSGSDVFSTPTPDNLNEKTGNEKLEETDQVESYLEPNDQPQDSMGLFSYLEKATEHMRNQKNEAKLPDNSNNAFPDEHCIKNNDYSIPMELNVSSDLFLYLATTALSVIIFLLGYFALDKSRREGPLVAKINKLEKEFLVILKEKEILAEQIANGIQQDEPVESQDFLNLQQEYEDVVRQKQGLEEQVQTLEKELENSTEVGLELNRMLSELLNSENAGETLMANIEQLQAQLAEQQEIVSNMKETLSLKETENHELNLELDIANKKVVELQSELDKLLLNIMKVEEEKESQEKQFEAEIGKLKENLAALNQSIKKHQEENSRTIDELNNKLSATERNLQLKTKEYDNLKATMQKIKTIKNPNTLESLLEVTSIKAELEQLKTESESHCNNMRKEKEKNSSLEKKLEKNEHEFDALAKKLDETDRARLELETKLQVLTTYFKDRETQLQKDLSKYESMWSAKQGEATSTSERIKYLQSEVQNYKSQNESLKEEIVSQEVELKSQISVLEKKVHENWVSARQAERRLEDLKQEAAQLRNRLTLRERALQEEKTNRMQSPLEQNGDGLMPPLHMDTPSSPPLLYSSRDHITKSPPMLGMPPPFLPPPPGAPFLPPPHMPFMPPPPPDMFPGDHRPPPLGRMSSPPLNSRYSPDRRPYSPYDRRSPSPSYDDSDFVSSPVHHRRYSPFSGMDHRRLGKVNGRSGALSSGSGNSNESLDGINHSNSKV